MKQRIIANDFTIMFIYFVFYSGNTFSGTNTGKKI